MAALSCTSEPFNPLCFGQKERRRIPRYASYVHDGLGGPSERTGALVKVTTYHLESLQDAFPILNIVAPHSPHLPRVAGFPFFIVTCSVSCISRFYLHFMPCPEIRPEFRNRAWQLQFACLDVVASVRHSLRCTV